MAPTSRSSSRCPPLCSATSEKVSALRIPIVIGTTGWLEHLAEAKALIEANNSALVWSPNFSVGVNVFTRLVSEAARLLANEKEYGAWAWEIHHITKKDAPSGTLIQLVDQDEGRGLRAQYRRQLQPRRRASGHARDRLRFRRRHHHACATPPAAGKASPEAL